VKRDIKASKRNRSETTLEDNIVLGLLFFSQLGLIVNTNTGQQPSNTYLGNVNLLQYEVHDFYETVPAIRDGDDLMEGCVIECLANAARIGGTMA